jgi:plastocyanin
MKSLDTLQSLRGGRRRSPVTLAASALVLVALVVAACVQAAPTAISPTEPPAAAPTVVSPTQPPAAAPSETPASAAITPSVTVSDQEIVNGGVTIARVVSAGPGWLVIHAQKDGAPGLVLGYIAVKEGDNADVVVQIDATRATATLYAMLHSDAGTIGTYEFPGSDGSVSVDGQVVTPAFAVTGGLAAAPAPESTVPLPSATPPAAAPPVVGGSPTVAVGEGEVELEDFQMVPKVLTVKVGTTVKFSNKDNAGHTVTSDTGVFDSGMLAKGEEFFFTFAKVGEYPYYCAPHGGPGCVGMSGVIIVVP